MDVLGIGIGLPQLLLVLVVAMLVLGPERLPEVARQIARGIRTLRGYATEVQEQFEGEIGDLRSEFMDIQQDLSSIHGNLRSGLLELDAGVRSVQTEMNTAVSSVSLLPAPSSGSTNGSAEPEQPASLDYVPEPPRPISFPTPVSSTTTTEPPADGRLPDYSPGSRR